MNRPSEFADSALIDNINPLVWVKEFNLPGTWSDPYPYAEYVPEQTQVNSVPCAVEPSCDTAKSPICDFGVSAGDGTIGMCMPTPPNCPMSRRLVPMRNIDPGMWVYNKEDRKSKTKSSSDNLSGILILVILIILIMYRSSAKS